MKNNRQLRVILLIIIAVTFSAVGIFFYISDMQNALWDHAVLEVLEVTSQNSHTFEIYLQKDIQILEKLVRQLSVKESDDEDSIIEIISSFEDTDTGFSVLDLDHGIIYAGENGSKKTIDNNELAAYEVLKENGIREPYIDEYTGRSMIGGYYRFVFADGSQGIAQVRRKIPVIANEFMLSFYSDTGFSYLTNKDGDILIRPSHPNSNNTFSNIMDVIQFSGNSKETIQLLCDSISQNRKGIIQLTFDEQKSCVIFTPINSTDGWYLITVIPDYAIMRHGNEVLKSSQTFLILMGCIFLIALLFLYMEQRSYKKIMQKEDDVQYREQLFSILANNTNDVFLMISPNDYQVEYISPNVERVLGISQTEVKKDIRVLKSNLPGNKDIINHNSISRLIVGRSISQQEQRIHRKTGELRWFMETVYKTSLNDSQRLVAVLSDRTREQKSSLALKEALAIAKNANESKSVFLSNMSHDIRTPMNAIVGFSTLLQRDAFNPEKVQAYTRKITASSQHLLGLINDVLDMSKIESGKTTLNISEICLAEIIEELGTMMQPQAKAKHQNFKIEVYDICNEELLGDRLRINQILINILSNAVKYTPQGGSIEMIVRQLPQYTKNYARFCFVIKDNGIGMSKEYLETIFQPFTRETNQKTIDIQGTGLGMAITKNLIDLMGGTIEVESELGKGSIFTLNLELRIKEEYIDPDFWKKHGVTNLLVVDDEEDICTGILNVMSDTKVNIEYALGGLTAVKMAENAQSCGRGFDLILIDWQMPDISGIETARRIRKIVPSHVPIMILTAYDISHIESEGVAAGIDGFLQKPFFISNFRLVVSNLKSRANFEEITEESNDMLDDILVGKHILAAEDNELNAEILLELLEMNEAICDLACNGQVALEKFEQSSSDQYDLILMDVQMPVMNGYEATRAIRKCGHPHAKTIPIIAMTANAFSEDIKEAMDAGMNEHVSKPIDMERLKSAIKKILFP